MTTLAHTLFTYPFVKTKKRVLDYALAKKTHALPIEENAEALFIAISEGTDPDTKKELELLLVKPLEYIYFPVEHIDAAIEQVYHQDDTEREAFMEGLAGDDHEMDEVDEIDILDQTTDSPIIRLLNMYCMEAVEQGASDIHFDPTEIGLSIRYRIDGVLQERHAPPKELQAQLLTRIKVLSKLDIAEKRLPQDGRIKMRIGGRTIDFRVSTVPVVYGERIVLRILDKQNIVLGLEKVAMPEVTLQGFRKAIHSNQGILLVTGPTGSGKTTTLYSALSEINSKEVNIMTIEDPVEYKLPGIAQIGTNSKIGLTFSRGLRHILRQDPDVVMIGEIRDKETAEIAIQASLTGHLVLSTLHTNDAPSAITRLVDMGIEPYLLSSSILAVLAQRLIRTICPHCKEAYVPSEQELCDLGINDVQQLYKGKGCEHCFHSGYSGRMGIYEYMPVTETIKNTLLKSAHASGIDAVAKEEGMQTLKNEGAKRAVQGHTTSAEVLRVTRGM